MRLKNLIWVLFTAVMIVSGQSHLLYAGAVNVGNQVCPVSGGAIGSMGDAFKVQHEGKEYNLCCKMCVKDFKKNPDKYIKIAEAEAAALSDHEGHAREHPAEQKESSDGHSGHHGKHDHH